MIARTEISLSFRVSGDSALCFGIDTFGKMIAQEHDPRPTVHDPSYIDITVARLDHLASILEQIGLQAPAGSVLELGAGVGDHSGFWIDPGFRLMTSVGRSE